MREETPDRDEREGAFEFGEAGAKVERIRPPPRSTRDLIPTSILACSKPLFAFYNNYLLL